MVFALYGENKTIMYYWLWRQWEMRGRRQRRALGEAWPVVIIHLWYHPPKASYVVESPVRHPFI